MKGQQADCVTTSGSMEILTGMDGVPETAKQRDINHNALTTVEITPVKAPSEIKSAIRRQKRTETLDYIWHALPVSRSSKPLYRAVLRGSLQPGSIQYTITNVNGHSPRSSNGCPKDESSFPNNDLKGFSQSGSFGLRVAGVSINEIKFQESAGRLSPRARLGQTVPVSRHMKPNFLEQKSSSSANGFKNRKVDYSVDVTEDSPRNTHVILPTKHFNGTSQSKPSNGHVNKSQLFTPLADEESNRVSPLFSPSASPSPVVENASESYKEKRHLQTATVQKVENNETTASSLTVAIRNPKSATTETHIKSGRENIRNDKTDLATVSNSESLTQQRPPESANQMAACKRSPRPADAIYSTQTKESSAVQDLTCMQLADSILGAVNGDLSEVYTLCKSKLRYSDFIEQSQPHRLGDSNSSQETNVSKATEQNNVLPVQCTDSPETPPTMFNVGTGKQPQSTTFEKTKEATRLPVIKSSSKSYQNVPSRYLNFSNNKTSRLRESEQDLDTQLQPLDATVTFGRAGRPILKTFKSDVESGSRTKDDHVMTPTSSADKNRLNYMDANNNANGVPSNRLVRFNTCHEVREFTPTEPIRQF